MLTQHQTICSTPWPPRVSRQCGPLPSLSCSFGCASPPSHASPVMLPPEKAYEPPTSTMLADPAACAVCKALRELLIAFMCCASSVQHAVKHADSMAGRAGPHCKGVLCMEDEQENGMPRPGKAASSGAVRVPGVRRDGARRGCPFGEAGLRLLPQGTQLELPASPSLPSPTVAYILLM